MPCLVYATGKLHNRNCICCSAGALQGITQRHTLSLSHAWLQWPEGHHADLQEEFYLEENVEKAITIDEWSPDALTTSMVDDVFFVLQKCGGRALAIGSLQCLCAILGQLNNLLRDSLRAALEYKWKVSHRVDSIRLSLCTRSCSASPEQHLMCG